MLKSRSLIKTIKITFLSVLSLVFLQELGYAQELTLASYNIRYANKDDSLKGNAWSERAPVIAQLVEFHDFDIFGTQEGLHHQLNELKALAPNYDYIGIGRGDHEDKGEFAAIFYKTAAFKLLDEGNFWLSEQTTYSNKGWDAANESYQLLAHSTLLKDAYELSPIKYALNGTFNAFNPNGKRDDRIDHIFLTDDFKVNRYGILTDTYRSVMVSDESVESSESKNTQIKSEARLPSDHFPVMIKVNMK